MKILSCLLACMVLLACSTSEKKVSMAGAYQLLKQNANDGKKDTVWNSSQMKLFTDGHFMYGGISSDSTNFFGFGEYVYDNGMVTEKVIFTASDSSSNSEPQSYQLAISRNDKGYTQVIKDIGTTVKYTLTEDYQNAGTGKVSPLDGAWKCTTLTIISTKGDTTKVDFVKSKATQYKIYSDGNIIFGGNWTDPDGLKHTAIGYGTFESVNDKLIKESPKLSTYKIAGQTLDLAIEMPDANHFKQTITDGSGSSIEEYERLAKK
jgi:hypothetical protein